MWCLMHKTWSEALIAATITVDKQDLLLELGHSVRVRGLHQRAVASGTRHLAARRVVVPRAVGRRSILLVQVEFRQNVGADG